MGKARQRRREEMRRNGLLVKKDVTPQHPSNEHDITELIPVMNKLGMSRTEMDTFQRAIVYFLISITNDNLPYASLVDKLPPPHREAAYNHITKFLERVLGKKEKEEK